MFSYEKQHNRFRSQDSGILTVVANCLSNNDESFALDLCQTVVCTEYMLMVLQKRLIRKRMLIKENEHDHEILVIR